MSTNHDHTPNPTQRSTFWQQHVDAWRTSGLSKAAYCKANALVYHQMIYWAGRCNAPEPAEALSSGFIPVSVRANEALKIVLPNGIEIHGFTEQSLSGLSQLLKHL